MAYARVILSALLGIIWISAKKILEGDFVFEAPAHRAFFGGAGEAEEIARLVSDISEPIEGIETGEHRPDAVLLVGEFARCGDVIDNAIELDAWLELRMEPHARLPGKEERRRVAAVVAHLLAAKEVERVERVLTEEVGHLLLHHGTEGDCVGVGARGGVRIFGEEAEIGPVFPLRRELKEVLERRRLVAQVLAGGRGPLALEPDLPERGRPDLDFVRIA